MQGVFLPCRGIISFSGTLLHAVSYGMTNITTVISCCCSKLTFELLYMLGNLPYDPKCVSIENHARGIVKLQSCLIGAWVKIWKFLQQGH